MNALFLIVSRGRPEYLKKTIESIFNTTTHGVKVFIGLDDDDPKLKEYNAIFEQYENIDGYVFPKRTGELYLSRLCNQLYCRVEQVVKDEADIIIPFADDIIIKTQDWKAMLVRRCPCDDLYIAYPFDGYRGCCTIPMLSRRVVDLAGFIAPDSLHHWYCDTWWGEVGRLSNRILYMPEIEFTHLTPFNPATKDVAPDDEVFRYSLRDNAKEIESDRATFESKAEIAKRIALAQKIHEEGLKERIIK